VQCVGDPRLRIYLYHIPPVAMVGITPDLVERHAEWRRRHDFRDRQR
jgi:hypothetical protein